MGDRLPIAVATDGRFVASGLFGVIKPGTLSCNVAPLNDGSACFTVRFVSRPTPAEITGGIDAMIRDLLGVDS
jgi:hypothetical protein